MTARTLAWTGFIAMAAFLLMASSRLTILDPVENVTLNVTSPLQSVMRSVTRPIADWVNNITDASTLSRESASTGSPAGLSTTPIAASR